MRIEINLARPGSRLERSLYVWAPAVITLAAILLIRALLSAGHEWAAYRRVHQFVLRYQAETGELAAQENRAQALLRQPPTLKLYQQINFLNSLIGQKRVSLSGLTLKVIKLLPRQARLTGLSLLETEEGPMVEFNVEGGEGKAVYGFLNRLEESPEFDSVTVADQTFGQQGADKGLITLTCSARYVGEGSGQH